MKYSYSMTGRVKRCVYLIHFGNICSFHTLPSSNLSKTLNWIILLSSAKLFLIVWRIFPENLSQIEWSDPILWLQEWRGVFSPYILAKNPIQTLNQKRQLVSQPNGLKLSGSVCVMQRNNSRGCPVEKIDKKFFHANLGQSTGQDPEYMLLLYKFVRSMDVKIWDWS